MTTTPTSGAADLPEALHRSTAADGKTELFNFPGYPLMVRAVDFNRLNTESALRRAALLDEMQKAALAAGQATAAQQGVAYAALPESFLEIPDVQDESGINAYYSREAVLECIDAALASHGQAPAGATEPTEQQILEAAFAPAQPAAEQGVAYAALPEYGINTASHAHFRVLGFTADQMRAFADATHTLRASHGQAPAGAAEELALTRHTNLAVVQRLQAKINALEAELDASRKAESQVQSYADDLDRRAQYDADNLADACGGYGGERI